jgi:hypothetical protein
MRCEHDESMVDVLGPAGVMVTDRGEDDACVVDLQRREHPTGTPAEARSADAKRARAGASPLITSPGRNRAGVFSQTPLSGDMPTLWIAERKNRHA